ncbi:hypothetical protein [Martelella sp. FOR1707]
MMKTRLLLAAATNPVDAAYDIERGTGRHKTKEAASPCSQALRSAGRSPWRGAGYALATVAAMQGAALAADQPNQLVEEASLQRYYWNGYSPNPAGGKWQGGPGDWDLVSPDWATSDTAASAGTWPQNGAFAVFGGYYYSPMTVKTGITLSGLEIQQPSAGPAPDSPSTASTSFTAIKPGLGYFVLPRQSSLLSAVTINNTDASTSHIPTFSLDIQDERPSGFFPALPSRLEITGNAIFAGHKSYTGETVLHPLGRLQLISDKTTGEFPVLAGGVRIESLGALGLQLDDSYGGFSYPFPFMTSVVADTAGTATRRAAVSISCASKTVGNAQVNIEDQLSKFGGILYLQNCLINLEGDTLLSTVQSYNTPQSDGVPLFTLAGSGTIGMSNSTHQAAKATISPGLPVPAEYPDLTPGLLGYLVFNGDVGVDSNSALVFDVGTAAASNGYPNTDPLVTTNNDFIMFNDSLSIYGTATVKIKGDILGDYTLMKAKKITPSGSLDNSFIANGSNGTLNYTIKTSVSGDYTYVNLNISAKSP